MELTDDGSVVVDSEVAMTLTDDGSVVVEGEEAVDPNVDVTKLF